MLVFWVGFNAFVLAMLALDLGFFHRRAHTVRFKEAIGWSVFWVVLAVIFAGIVYQWRGPELALQFATGYLVEQSLSVDNLFVFLLLFSFFKVPSEHQHKVLFWGIIGALVMRLIFIIAGVALIQRFHWIIYIFGAVLIYSGIKLVFNDEDFDAEKSTTLKLVRRYVPLTDDFVGGKFFVRRDQRRFATPLFAVLVVVEVTDLLFAVDSIPAILAISRDPFIVYTSNVFAILGLRTMFFAVSGLIELFEYLNYGLAAVLVFIGVKMLLTYERFHVEIPIAVTLSVIGGILGLSIGASLLFGRRKKAHHGRNL
jgi:tellurite resistance protein TerC